MIFVVDRQSGSASGDEIAEIDAFNQLLRDNQEFVLAVGIAAPTSATVIDNRSEPAVVHAGSVFDDDEFYSGFWVIDVDSIDIARERAMLGSRACNRKVELRPLL